MPNNISICMIARDEDSTLPRCLSLLRPRFSEIILVDTGSTDNTLRTARQYGAKTYELAWSNDFAEARNYSLAIASNDLILVVDCDEYLEDIDMAAFLACVKKNPQGIGMILRHNPHGGDANKLMSERVGRLFDRRLYRYEGIIHEQIVRIDAGKPEYYHLPISFFHEGYAKKETAKAKALRNRDLLLIDLGKKGPDPYTYFQLGQSETVLEDYAAACHFYGLGLEFDLEPGLEYVQTMVESYGYALLEEKRYAEALSFISIYDTFAVRADFVFLMGLIYMNNARFEEAIAEFAKAATMKQAAATGVNSYAAFYNIGVIYECLSDKELARDFYRKCGSYAPALARLDAL